MALIFVCFFNNKGRFFINITFFHKDYQINVFILRNFNFLLSRSITLNDSEKTKSKIVY